MLPIDYSTNSFRKLKDWSAAEILVEYLKLEKVRYVFGVSGGTIVSLMEALYDCDDIDFIMAKHECGAAYMADAYARVSGILGVCLSTAGPGATNMLTGVAGAQQDGVPLLAITGQPATHTAGKGAVQESSSFGVDTVNIYDHFAGFSSVIYEPAIFRQVVSQALRVSLGERKQASHLSIPTNVSSHRFEEYDFPGDSKKYRVVHSSIDHEQISQAAELLLHAGKPVILVGAGARMMDNIEDLIQVAEMLHCPVMTTPKGKGIFPEDHPLSLGVFGFAGNTSAQKYLLEEDVDLLLVISSQMGEWTTQSWDTRLFPSKYMIQVDIYPQNIGKNFPVSLGIVGDISSVINELLIKLLRSKNRGSAAANAKEEKSTIPDFKRRTKYYLNEELMESDAVPLKPQRVMHELNCCLEKDAIVIADAGNSYAWTLHYLKINPPQKFLIALGIATMGYAAAGVVGAKLAAPDRQVIAITGDGSTLMNGTEIHTAVEYNIPAIWIVLNDGGWGMVYHGLKALGKNPIASEFHQVDFAEFARVLGADGYRVTKPGDLTRVMPEVLSNGKPAVIDVVIDKEEEPPFLERIKSIRKYMDQDNKK